MEYTQQGRPMQIVTPLGQDVLLLESFRCDEALSAPFDLSCTVLAAQGPVAVDKLLRLPVCIHLETDERGSPRYFQGFVRQVDYLGRRDPFEVYSLSVVPWLWFLSLSSDCRIFQNRTVPEIVEAMFAKHGQRDYRLQLAGDYPRREYCVQYRESDLSFVQRLLEQEGIHYFFEHDAQRHVLVLSDQSPAAKPCPAKPEARFHGNLRMQRDDDVVQGFRLSRRVHTAAVSLVDFAFEQPDRDLEVTEGNQKASEAYDYPGGYTERNDGRRYARLQVEEQEAGRHVADGEGDCRAFTTGYRFRLRDHAVPELCADYLLERITHAAESNHYRSADGQSPFAYRNSFRVIPSSVPYRPPRMTPKPVVRGSQTAIVVGPEGEEVAPDRHGRVKVHFHWDRRNGRDENASCWIRVSQPWAGKNWGAISIPRIGQEVIVDFLEGDPDRPIITGRVYNGDMKPPYDLPGGASVMGFKSKSIKGGGYNEISINDTNATEGIEIHAQYNMNTRVEHDETVFIGNDRTEEVVNNEKITVGNDRTEEVGSNEKVTVGGNQTLGIDGNRSENVGKNEMLTVALTRTHSVGINDMLNVGGAQQINVGGIRLVTVGLAQLVNVGMKYTLDAGTAAKITAPEILFEATNELTLTCGGAKISIDAAGIITINGTLVKVNC